MSELIDIKNRLREIIREKAFLHGEFLLSSGETSEFYFDCRTVTLDAEGLPILSEILIEMMKADGVDAIGGLAIGADPIVGGVVSLGSRRAYPVQGFIVRKERKEHGTKKRIEGPALEAGTKVAIVDDVITSGGSIITAIEAVREEGLKPVVAYALVDRQQGGAAKIEAMGVPFRPLFKYKELLT